MELELTKQQKKELKTLFVAWQYDKQETEVFDFCTKHNIEMTQVPELIYSQRQLKFIDDAIKSGLRVDYTYSGRGMFGDTCPSVRVDEMNDLQTDTKPSCDNMGLGYVLYVP